MQLTKAQIIEYQTTGCLIAENVLTSDDLQPLIHEINGFVEGRVCRFLDAGKITDTYRKLPFEKRFAALCRECPEIGVQFDIMYLLGKEMFAFMRNEHLLDAVECLLGSELTCNPVQHLRAKMPAGSTWRTVTEDVPWHQDAQVNREGDGLQADIITCWIPLVDATEQTGAMDVLPGVFNFGLMDHISEEDKLGPTIADKRVCDEDGILAPCRKGGVVFLNKYTPHRGNPNRSDIVRWSLDIRYQRVGSPSGRPRHPDFVVRSRKTPDSVLDDHEDWCRRWRHGLGAKPIARPEARLSN